MFLIHVPGVGTLDGWFQPRLLLCRNLPPSALTIEHPDGPMYYIPSDDPQLMAIINAQKPHHVMPEDIDEHR